MVAVVRRCFVLMLLLCLGCGAQSVAPELKANIEKHVRANYGVPPQVDITISDRTPSDIAGFDKVVVTFAQGEHKQTHDFLLSKDNKTLIRLTRLDLTTDPYTEVMKKIDTQGRPVRGAANAKVTIVNFDDFQCPFCARMHRTLFDDVMKTYGDRVRVIYKDYPLTEIHPWSNRAAIDANCLATVSNDAYWDFADTVHGNPRAISGDKLAVAGQMANLDKLTLEEGQKFHVDMPRLEACVKAQPQEALKKSEEEAKALGVEATPTLYVNGQKIDGAVPPDELRAVIDRALKDAGVPPPVKPENPEKPAAPGAAALK